MEDINQLKLNQFNALAKAMENMCGINPITRVTELKQQNADQLAALKAVHSWYSSDDEDAELLKALALVEQAIARAEADRKSPRHPCDVELP
jgi:hypothetical protein